jgi:hypothetical protein
MNQIVSSHEAMPGNDQQMFGNQGGIFLFLAVAANWEFRQDFTLVAIDHRDLAFGGT